MNILVTGLSGFIGRNLAAHLAQAGEHAILGVAHDASDEEFASAAARADFAVHLAGVNRPQTEDELEAGNDRFTGRLCQILATTGRPIPLLYASSIQAEQDNPYGASKRAGEQRVRDYGEAAGARTFIYRLPNVFGKWSRPNYNSAVATFCHNLARDLPIVVHDPGAALSLVYIDDVVAEFIAALEGKVQSATPEVSPVYRTSVGQVVDQIKAFRESRHTLISERVGTGLTRALYATYLSHLPQESFSYDVPKYEDARGVFVEMLKTPDAGQFSFFSARPGMTRGGHFHHSKTEKFLVVKGRARFGFRHIVTGESFSLCTDGNEPRIVETVPGWSHDITNVGEDDLLVLLWANEIFDRSNPDTYAHAV